MYGICFLPCSFPQLLLLSTPTMPVTMMKPAVACLQASLRETPRLSGLSVAARLQLRPRLGARVCMSTVVDHPRVPTSSTLPPPSAPSSSIETTDETNVKTESERRQNARRILREAVAATGPRHTWTREEIAAIYYQPLTELAFQSVRASNLMCFVLSHISTEC